MTELKKVLDFKVILLITINAVMGTGIFFLPAIGAGVAGPASLLSWVAMGLVAIYISMCFAELTSMYPQAGGVYEFCKHAYGRFTSFIIGWITMIAGNITIAMLIVGAIQYLVPVVPSFVKIPLSIAFILIFNTIAYRGMKTSAVMLVTFAFITLITLFGLIIPGLFQINPNNFSPFFAFPVSAVFVAIFFIAETFFGWETATFLAEETKDGAKVMPKVLIISTILIALISLLFVFISLGTINWQIWGVSAAPLTDLSKIFYGTIGGHIFTLLVYLAIIGSVAGWIVSSPRLLLSMARDRLFLKPLASINRKYHTPHNAIIFQTILTSIIIIAGAGSYTTLVLILVPLVLVMYSAILLSLVVLRYKHPEVKRYYTAPFGKVGPYFIIIILLSLIGYWVATEEGALHLLQLGASFILMGVPVYFLLEMYYSPKAVRKTNNLLAYVTLFSEVFFLPKAVREKVLHLIGNLHGKKVLEFGCSVGTFTLHLAEKVGKQGHVYATDISEKDLIIAQRRMDRRGHHHVHILHDIHHMHRVHPRIPKVDAIVSIGTLGYLTDVKRVLRELNERLPLHGKVCFLDYDKFFDIIPNIDWLTEDAKIRKLFYEGGFTVSVIREQGFSWKYIYIYGMKYKSL